VRFDRVAITLCYWLLVGAFLDGWAHAHDMADTSFLTPWHLVFYSGYLAVTSYLVASWARARALPTGYGLSLLGALLFACGGAADVLWHGLFGIEQGVEALLSPPHLMLAGGVGLIVGGPFRAAWHRPGPSIPGWAGLWPGILSLIGMLTMCTLVTQMANPVANLWGAGTPQEPAWLFGEAGVVGILVDTGLVMGFVLVMLHRWVPPPGTLTVVLTLNALPMSLVYQQGDPPLLHVVARGVAGLVADALLNWLRPSAERPRALRLFALAVPVNATGLYFLATQLTAGLWWPIHVWTGAILLSGVVGLLLSYLLRPPLLPPSRAEALRSSRDTKVDGRASEPSPRGRLDPAGGEP
jgi:hypothetical protein